MEAKDVIVALRRAETGVAKLADDDVLAEAVRELAWAVETAFIDGDGEEVKR